MSKRKFGSPFLDGNKRVKQVRFNLVHLSAGVNSRRWIKIRLVLIEELSLGHSCLLLLFSTDKDC